jgi:hypothetical protein
LISQYADPKVNQNVKQSFFENVLPGTISRLIAQDLEVRPFTQWSQRLEEYINILGKSAPNQMSKIRASISAAFSTILKNKSFENQAVANQLKNDPKWKALSEKLDLRLPETT